jgi:hypothetical protein
MTSTTLRVPSRAIETLFPFLTPPITKPSVVGGKSLIVPAEVIVFPVAGAPSPTPAVIDVTVPLFTVERYPLDEIARPVLGMTTPREVVVATGNPTPLKVCPEANVITPVITPPDLGRAEVTAVCAMTAASYAVLTAALVAACVVDGELTAFERVVMPKAPVVATLFARPCGVTATVFSAPVTVSALVAKRT